MSIELSDDLLLDVEIRNYVLVPILVLMIFVTILRNEVMIFFHSAPVNDLKKLRDGQIMSRARRLRACGSRIPEDGFERRKAFLVHADQGLLTKKSRPPPNQNDNGLPNMANSPLMDPNNMGSMMKGQAAMIFSQIYLLVLYNLIDHFFSGFVSAKLPFALTRGFKGMFHSGIDLPSLQVSYVSSSSWYLLIFSGLRELSVVLFGAGANIQMTPMAPMPQQNLFTDPTKSFLAEKESVQNTPHDWVCEDSIKRLANAIRKKQ